MILLVLLIGTLFQSIMDVDKKLGMSLDDLIKKTRPAAGPKKGAARGTMKSVARKGVVVPKSGGGKNKLGYVVYSDWRMGTF